MKEEIISPLIPNNLNSKAWSSIFFSYRQPAVAVEFFATIFFFDNQTIKLLMKLMMMLVMFMVMVMVKLMVMMMVMFMVMVMVMMMVMLEAVFFVRQSGSGTSGNFVHPGSLQRRG